MEEICSFDVVTRLMNWEDNFPETEAERDSAKSHYQKCITCQKNGEKAFKEYLDNPLAWLFLPSGAKTVVELFDLAYQATVEQKKITSDHNAKILARFMVGGSEVAGNLFRLIRRYQTFVNLVSLEAPLPLCKDQIRLIRETLVNLKTEVGEETLDSVLAVGDNGFSDAMKALERLGSFERSGN